MRNDAPAMIARRDPSLLRTQLQPTTARNLGQAHKVFPHRIRLRVAREKSLELGLKGGGVWEGKARKGGNY